MSDPWKACDIRGVFPSEVSPDLFRRLGRSIGSSLPAASPVVVAGDFRPSTPTLKSALAEGLLESGADVLDAGQIPTPVAYFAHHHWQTSAVLIVTASHNPPEYNGLKLMLGNLPPTPEDLSRLRCGVEEGLWRRGSGKLAVVDPVPAYRDWILKRWSCARKSAGMPVMLDAGNGAWSDLGPSLFEAVGFRVHQLFCEMDGTFPHRSPDCARSSSLAALRSRMVQAGAQIGIAWDGDGDRVAIVDNEGAIVSTDEISALIVRDLVPREPSAKVIHDIKLSELVRRAVIASGGQPVVQRSGHAFIKRAMIAEKALFGCEASGHYFFRELQGGDDGLFAALLITDLVRRSGLALKELRRTLPPFFVTPDLRIPSSLLAFEEMVKRFRSKLPSAKESALDGVRWEIAQGYIVARNSVTEPVVTLRLEGNNQGSLNELIELCLRTFPEAAEEISRQMDSLHDSQSSD